MRFRTLPITVRLAAVTLAAACVAGSAAAESATPPALAALPAPPAPPAPQYWVASWTASPQPLWGGDFVLPTNLPFQFQQQTLRQIVRLSLGGEQLRVQLSNAYGTQPLRIAAAHVALSAGGPAIVPGSDRALTFGGARGVEIAPGGQVVSDAVALRSQPLSRLAVSLHVPGPAAPSTFHWDARQTAYVAAGDQTAATSLADDGTRATLQSRIYLSGILVSTPRPARVVVALGDSITDGNGSTPDNDRRWPDALARRLAAHGVATVNAGISGARLLKDGMGASASARFTADVLAQPRVAAVIVLLGINDIGWPGGPFAPHDAPVSADALITGLRQLIARARTQGVRIVGATLLPFEGALAGTPLEGHHSPAKDEARQQLNAWIRSGGEFDAVVDFDAVLRDPLRPSRLRADYDSGDHLHPGDSGYAAMAEAVDLEALLGPRTATTP